MLLETRWKHFGQKENNNCHFFQLESDIHRKKLCFTKVLLNSVQRMAAGLLLIFFICLHNQLKNVIHQINSKNEWLLLSPSLTAKVVWVFVLTVENTFS